MNYICLFPDRTEVAVNVIKTEGTQTQVRWTLERGIVSNVWVPSAWVFHKH